ncbi:MAG: dihydrodipicolinate synthase family protein [Lachnospiraceae bacterium]
MKRKNRCGVWPVMLTPFTEDNQVDYDALRELIKWYLRNGVDGLFAVCQSSEMFYLSLKERVEIARFVKETVAGRVPVIASGHISDGVEEQVEEILAIANTGVDAVILITNRLAKEEESDEVWLNHLKDLLTQIPEEIHLGFYECPYPYKRVLSPEMVKWCAESGRFYFLKDTCCDIKQIREKLAACRDSRLKLYNANTATLLESLRLGAAGYSGVMANMQCSLYVRLCQDFENPEFDMEKLSRELTMHALIERQYYPVNAKYYLQIEGLGCTLKTRTKDAGGLNETFRQEIRMLHKETQELRRQYRTLEVEKLNPWELPQYTDEVLPNCDYHHGQIFPAKGVKCVQIVRANRLHPEWADGTNSTYKHAPDLAYWNGKFYVQYLCNPVEEHTGAGYSVLASSSDGRNWGGFEISFPEYCIPKTTVTDYKGLTHTFDGTTYGFMHQRMSFYRSSQNRMLLLGFYGWSPYKWMTNWDNYGIGRVVRELYADGSLSEIYFIKPNWQGGWKKEDLNYPLYTESADVGFVAACEELLEDSLAVQQWAEENGDTDEHILIKHPKDGGTYQAFCWYHIDNQEVVGLWKHSFTARSHDGGKHWGPVEKSPSLVMSGQKVWGQKTSDGKFAMIYDPTLETEHRYPLCITTSEDGIHFSKMRLIHGQVPRLRYAGFWKDLGPQYMRGIAEGILPEVSKSNIPEKDGKKFPKDADIYVTYSVNKEDIWFAQIPVPVEDEQRSEFEEYLADEDSRRNWNEYVPSWVKTEIRPVKDFACQGLYIEDREPMDFSIMERVFMPKAEKNGKIVEVTLIPEVIGEALYLELMDAKGEIAVRLVLRANGKLYARTVTELEVGDYQLGVPLTIRIAMDSRYFCYELMLNGKPVCSEKQKILEWNYMQAVTEISRFSIRTGKREHEISLNTIPGHLLDMEEEMSEPSKFMTAYTFVKFKIEDI